MAQAASAARRLRYITLRRVPASVGIALHVVRIRVAMIRDLITAFLVAFAAVTASEVLTRIWESF